MSKNDFYAGLAEEMLKYSEDELQNSYDSLVVYNDYFNPTTESTDDVPVCTIAHERIMSHASAKRPYCVVCKLEAGIVKRTTHVRSLSRSQKHMSFCAQCQSFLHASVPFESKWHTIEGLAGKSCFDIFHSDVCKGLWILNLDTENRQSYGVSTKHPVYIELCAKYNAPTKTRTKK